MELRTKLLFCLLSALAVSSSACSSRNLKPGELQEPCAILNTEDLVDLLTAKVDPGIPDRSRRTQHVCTFLFTDKNDTGAISLALYLPSEISPKQRWEAMKENFKKATTNAFRVKDIGDDAAWVELAPQYYGLFVLNNGYIFTLNVTYPHANSSTEEFRIAYKLAQLVTYRLDNGLEPDTDSILDKDT